MILSQNTSYSNEARAYEQLERTIGVEPRRLAEAGVEEIASAIRPAGMHNIRAKVIKRLSEIVVSKYNGDLSRILIKELQEAREELIRLPGVGRKSADVVLLFEANKPVMPVDRHIFRIAERLGLVSGNQDYERVRSILESIIPREELEIGHLSLIDFGRRICRTRLPLCGSCFIAESCPSAKLGKVKGSRRARPARARDTGVDD
ncbi:endonuclease III [Candidatus Bathyarchaeota archaeon]|nr:endonuclease III [Candidatus Bathyarchaeota archaeon]